jgi:hypothetical protein
MAEPNPDIVYFTRTNIGEQNNDEFRMSLRSVTNLPHNRVFVIGGKPDWVENVHHVPFRDGPNKWLNIMRRWVLLGELTEPSNTVYRMCDDDYVLNPVVGLQPKYYTNTVKERYKYLVGLGGRGWYTQGFKNSLPLLKEMGFDDPLNHKIHLPLTVDRDVIPTGLLADHVKRKLVIHGPLFAGNLSPQEPVQIKHDWKVRTMTDWQMCLEMNMGFASSSEATFEPSGLQGRLLVRFPDKGVYERQ